jgi:xanthine dehydrogenase accessory factor
MSELKALIERAEALRRAGQPALLATLVAVRGSSYRRPGARLLIGCDGVLAGEVSGGCLERDLTRRGWWHTANDRAALVTYGSTDDDDDLGVRLGLGCDGAVDILIERLGPNGGEDRPLDFIARCLKDEAEGLLLTVCQSTDPSIPVGGWLGLGADDGLSGTIVRKELATLARRLCANGLRRATAVALDGGSVELLAEPIRPPPHLFVLGCGPDAVPLIVLGRSLGWTTTVWDPRARFETRIRFAAVDERHTGAAVSLLPAINRAFQPVAVVSSHDVERDREALTMLSRSRTRYVGVLGPRRRTERLLAQAGLSIPGFPSLHAPAGLSIGAETSAEIALSIVAEIEALLNEEVVGHLRDRQGPIHAKAAASPVPSIARMDPSNVQGSFRS